MAVTRNGGALWVLGAYCACFMVPVRWSLGGTTLGLLDVAAFALIVWILAHGDGLARLLVRTPVLLPLLAYATVLMLGLAGSTAVGTFAKESLKLVQGLALYLGFALVFAGGGERMARRAMTIWCATMVAVVLIAAVWQLQFMRSVSNPFIDPGITQRYFRFGWGTFAASNYFAGMLLLVIPPVLFHLTIPAAGERRRGRVASAIALLTFGAALAASFSRGAMAALLLGFLFSVLLPVPGRARRLGVLALVAGIVAIGVSLSPIGWRVFSFAGRTVDELTTARTDLWGEALRQFGNHPVLGVGLGSLDLGGPGDLARTYAHNAILQIGAETGILGLATYAAFLAALLWTNWSVHLRTAGRPDAWVFAGSLTALVVMLAHNMVENTLVGGVLYGFLLWPIQGIVLARYWELDGTVPVRPAPTTHPDAPLLLPALDREPLRG